MVPGSRARVVGGAVRQRLVHRWGDRTFSGVVSASHVRQLAARVPDYRSAGIPVVDGVAPRLLSASATSKNHGGGAGVDSRLTRDSCRADGPEFRYPTGYDAPRAV